MYCVILQHHNTAIICRTTLRTQVRSETSSRYYDAKRTAQHTEKKERKHHDTTNCTPLCAPHCHRVLQPRLLHHALALQPTDRPMVHHQSTQAIQTHHTHAQRSHVYLQVYLTTHRVLYCNCIIAAAPQHHVRYVEYRNAHTWYSTIRDYHSANSTRSQTSRCICQTRKGAMVKPQ